MRPHEKPTFDYAFDLDDQLAVLRNHSKHRKLPEASGDNLRIATWNLTNFGRQERGDEHLRLMAEIVGLFDLVAVQEVADDLGQMNTMLEMLGGNWNFVYTDIAGNQERLGYLFDTTRLVPTGLAAELAMRSYERKRIVVEVGDQQEESSFEGFNRNPFMLSFRADDFEFSIVNVHLYWTDYQIRRMEAKALGKWAKSRVDKAYPPHNDIILIGDFNMPRVTEGDQIYDALVESGVRFPKHDTELIGSNLAGDKDYDEAAFFPSRTGEDFSGRLGVFDFDKVLFGDLWSVDDLDQRKRFFQYIRYYVADHRPMWMEFKRHA